MQYCKRCRAWIETPAKRCPLCQGVLEGEPDPEGQMFPDVTRTTSAIELGFKIFTFVCVAMVILGFAGNLILKSQVFWAGFVAAAVACMWILTAVGIRKRRNLLKNTLWQMVLLWGDISFLGFSYRVSGMGVGICSSHCDFIGLSDSDGDGEGYETAGSLLYDLLYSGM